MNIRILLTGLSVLLVALGANAQISVNKDSLSLVSKLTNDREKLLKYQSLVASYTKEKEESATKAQTSANDNRDAANQLSNDPQDRKLARQADKAAGDARSDAKKARRAADRLDQLNKNITDISARIDKQQTQLNKYLLTAPILIAPKDSSTETPR